MLAANQAASWVRDLYPVDDEGEGEIDEGHAVGDYNPHSSSNRLLFTPRFVVTREPTYEIWGVIDSRLVGPERSLPLIDSRFDRVEHVIACKGIDADAAASPCALLPGGRHTCVTCGTYL